MSFPGRKEGICSKSVRNVGISSTVFATTERTTKELTIKPDFFNLMKRKCNSYLLTAGRTGRHVDMVVTTQPGEEVATKTVLF